MYDGLSGASVGDSGALLIDGGPPLDLTAAQQRNPLLGSGIAIPMPIIHSRIAGTLVLATDGLWMYAATPAIRELAGEGEPDPRLLIDQARMPSGGHQDDVAVIMCRRK